jgi:hypothetical protein
MTVVGLVALLATSPAAQPDYSDWSSPENLGFVVNSTFSDRGPHLSKDGLSLYFFSNRPSSFNPGFDIWVSQRNSLEDSWGEPVILGSDINTTSQFEQDPNLSRDGHWLFFVSFNRPGGFGGPDIWMSYREHVHDDFGWQPPVNAGPGVNSVDGEFRPMFFENDDLGVSQLFFSRGGDEIYVSDLLPDGTFGSPTLVSELSGLTLSPGSVRFDGLEAFLFGMRSPRLGLNDMWTTTRQTVFDSWSTPYNLGPVLNTTAGDLDPYITTDRQTLYFGSNRPGGVGGNDLYVSTRTKYHVKRQGNQ